MKFYYYQKKDATKQLLAIFEKESIVEADEQSEKLTGINPAKDKSIIVTLEPLTSGETLCS